MQSPAPLALAALLFVTQVVAAPCGKGSGNQHNWPTPTILAPVVIPSYAPPPSSPASEPIPLIPTHPPATAVTPAPATVKDPSTPGISADQKQALDEHNKARAEVGAAALTWDKALASDALSWANHLASTAGSSGSLTHASGTGQGENLYWQSNSDTPYVSGATAWIDEKSLYKGEPITGNGNFESYGHYTQVAWHSTTKVGMAAAPDGSGGFYVVARYSPPGNIIGQTPSS